MPRDKYNLRIRIIGAGMGGLAVALALAKKGFKDIQVFERASSADEPVGAGIQMAPNMARILDRLGVWKDVEKEAVVLEETSIRQGSTDQELAHVDLQYIEKQYSYPHTVGHRVSLAGALYRGCKSQKYITFNFATAAENIKPFLCTPTFTAVPRNGDLPYEVEADILLAADGVKSQTRERMMEHLGVEARVEDTGQAAYRIMLTRDQMKDDPELLELIDSNKVTRWIGERRHIIAYPVANKSIYNISTAQPDVNFAAAPTETYTTRGSKKAMLNVYKDFCPLVCRMLNLVPEGEVCEWKLRVHKPLVTWIVSSTALIGDSCHATLPHLAQGASSAIEDGAVISDVLSRIPDGSVDAIRRGLLVYERIRKGRAETLVDLAAQSGRALHLGEGKAKEERDKQFAALKTGKGPVPDRWADPDTQKMIYGFDCAKATEEMFWKTYGQLVV